MSTRSFVLRTAVLISLLSTPVAIVVVAQQSAAAARQAGSWFNNAHDVFLLRLDALVATDLDQWEAAAKKAGITASRADLGFTLPKFNPLFDARQKTVPGAVAKYARRLGQLPRTSVAQWQAATGGEALVVAMSLTAEDSLFPKEVYSNEAFRRFVARVRD